MAQQPQSPTTLRLRFETWIRRAGQVFLVPVARLANRAGLTPNLLTLLGLALNAVVAVVVSRYSLRWGGALLILASIFDALDGTLARLTGQQSQFGAFFDSTIDRFSEAVVYGGLLYYFSAQDAQVETLLAYAAIIGSLMVSYTRARSEGLGVDCKVGLLTRVERMAVLAFGLILGRTALALWLVAILANLTALQRILHVRRRLAE
jgi:CDP-diacylglycerol--glycerol-3-phosphate 3-phosphatidyltransferase